MWLAKVPTEQIQALLGHANKTTTEIYIKLRSGGRGAEHGHDDAEGASLISSTDASESEHWRWQIFHGT